MITIRTHPPQPEEHFLIHGHITDAGYIIVVSWHRPSWHYVIEAERVAGGWKPALEHCQGAYQHAIVQHGKAHEGGIYPANPTYDALYNASLTEHEQGTCSP